eukprot:TRINITY_DN1128_c0_g1_i1.p1 TRINITY_DN1128_c0_g1~~TRINITY_DN1128_c0_g1_i1.p1  ORF type:complete len:101 (+),score=5.93 TRINITY_DN1128_c0_g1_i1:1107-1409(+)
MHTSDKGRIKDGHCGHIRSGSKFAVSYIFFFRLAFVYRPHTYKGDIEIVILMLLSIYLCDLNGVISDVLDCGGTKKSVLKRDVCRSRTTKPISYRCVRLQ